jgi:hypothetical protein
MLEKQAGAIGDQQTRASDEDRQDAVNLLHCAYTAGRLDLDELRERSGAAYAAISWRQLRDLTADLPYQLNEARWQRRADAEARHRRAWPSVRRGRPGICPTLISVVLVLVAIASPIAAAVMLIVLLAIWLLWGAR